MRKTAVLSFILSLSIIVTARATQLGSWTMFFNQSRLNTNWSLHSEIQYRSYEVLPNTEQFLLRFGLNYHLSNSLVFSCGYARVGNYSSGEIADKVFLSNENRAFEQVSLKNLIGRLNLEHRYRFEQRWLKSNSKSEYKNRIRYLLRATFPINNKDLIKNTFFVSAYDEIFIQFTATPFDRNRLFGSLGYQFSKNSNLQIGYLLQTVGTDSKSYLQFGLNYNLDFRKN